MSIQAECTTSQSSRMYKGSVLHDIQPVSLATMFNQSVWHNVQPVSLAMNEQPVNLAGLQSVSLAMNVQPVSLADCKTSQSSYECTTSQSRRLYNQFV